MTQEEYQTKEKETFDYYRIPAEFRSALSFYAYEKGHGAGMEEVLNYLKGLCDALDKPFREYEENVSDYYLSM